MNYQKYIKLITFDDVIKPTLEQEFLSDDELIVELNMLFRNKKSYYNDFLISQLICEMYHRGMNIQFNGLKLFV